MDTFPICGNCQTTFSLKGPSPQLLPCLHSVCETCVTAAASGSIFCSTCHRDFDLAETTLPKDIVREREIFQLTAKHQPSELLCTHGEDGNQAVCWCLDCEEFLCENCQTLHDSFKVTRKHTIQEMRERSMLSLEQDRFCSVHKKYILDTYDTDCKILICLRCKLEGHDDHNVEDVDKAYDSAKLVLGKAIDYELNVFEDTGKTIERLEQEMKLQEDTCSNLNDTISLIFSTLGSLLDQRQKEVHLDLDRLANINKDDLSRQVSRFEDLGGNTSATLEYFKKALMYATKCDLLTLASSLDKITQTRQAAAGDVAEESVPTIIYSSPGLQGLRETLSKFGSVTAGLCGGGKLCSEPITQTHSDDRTTVYLDNSLESSFGCIARMKYGMFKSQCILRPHLKYDEAALSWVYNYIKADGDLANQKCSRSSIGNTIGRFTVFHGTCSTKSIRQVWCPQYWEVLARGVLKSTLKENDRLLQIGLCCEKERDRKTSIGRGPHTYKLTVKHCSTHHHICRTVRKEDCAERCVPSTVVNTKGRSFRLHYGVLYDDERKRIAFLDVAEAKVLQILKSVYCREQLWPMFRLYNANIATTDMTLIVGDDIDMTKQKEDLILKALE